MEILSFQGGCHEKQREKYPIFSDKSFLIFLCNASLFPLVNSIYKKHLSPDIPFLLWKPDFCFRILFFYMML